MEPKPGPHSSSILYSLTHKDSFKTKFVVEGEASSGFESIKKIFKNNFEEGREINAQCAVYFKGNLVVDLFGRRDNKTDSKQYNFDTMQLIFSSTKVLSSLCMAMAEDRGQFQYDDPIAKYWPEFGVNGKDKITIKDLLQHCSGLATPDGELTRENLQHLDKIATFFAEQAPKYPPNNKKVYHSISRGFIENEIFRRTDPQKRTIGKYLEEEIRKPLNLRTFIGLPIEEEINVAPIVLEPIQYTVTNLVVPYFLGGKFSFVPKLDRWTKYVTEKLIDKNSFTRKSLSFLEDGFDFKKMNTPEFHKVEAPSFGGLSNARSLAKLGCILANKGEFFGVKLLSEAGYARAMAHEAPTFDEGVGLVASITSAGFGKNFDVLEGIDNDWYGWSGMGGSLVLWNPKYNASFSYTMNAMGHYGAVDARAFSLIQETDKCIKEIISENGFTECSIVNFD